MQIGYPPKKCQRCGARWLPRVPEPVRCPRCQSVKWREAKP